MHERSHVIAFMRVELLVGSCNPMIATGSRRSGPLVDHGLKIAQKAVDSLTKSRHMLLLSSSIPLVQIPL